MAWGRGTGQQHPCSYRATSTWRDRGGGCGKNDSRWSLNVIILDRSRQGGTEQYGDRSEKDNQFAHCIHNPSRRSKGQREKRIHVSLCTTSIDKPEGRIAKVESLTRIVSFCESITSRGQSSPEDLSTGHISKGPRVVSRWAQRRDQRCPTVSIGAPIASHSLAVDYSRGTLRLRKRQLSLGGALAAPRKWRKSGS
jgi:hypothetical protein